jgi:D-alanyl-D-alanine-carboxypeptidase/D-alanyl-D-alanine-endopeptidase
LTLPKTPNAVAVASRIFDRYVGRYQVGPTIVMTITREGAHFFAQLTGQPKLEIFAESEKDYFLKVVDAQLTFDTDANGRATSVVLHQNGQAQRAKRIEGNAPPATAAPGAAAL